MQIDMFLVTLLFDCFTSVLFMYLFLVFSVDY
jgi:hypothetical protein